MRRKKKQLIVQSTLIGVGLGAGLAIPLTLLFTPEQARKDREKLVEMDLLKPVQRNAVETLALYAAGAPHVTEADAAEAGQILVTHFLMDKGVWKDVQKYREERLKTTSTQSTV